MVWSRFFVSPSLELVALAPQEHAPTLHISHPRHTENTSTTSWVGMNGRVPTPHKFTLLDPSSRSVMKAVWWCLTGCKSRCICFAHWKADKNTWQYLAIFFVWRFKRFRVDTKPGQSLKTITGSHVFPPNLSVFYPDLCFVPALAISLMFHLEGFQM